MIIVYARTAGLSLEVTALYKKVATLSLDKPSFLAFYFILELVTGVQQSNSVIHIHVSILFQILFPIRLLQNIEQSSLCYTACPCWISILNIVVCTCQSQTP